MSSRAKKFVVRPSAAMNSDINVTPLVDVVLVLLIIFMVVTPLLEKDIAVRVPDTEKVDYACRGWTEQTETSMDTSTGYGPTLVAEWSQADTDCATYLNNVGWGNRWTGTYDTGNASDPLQRDPN